MSRTRIFPGTQADRHERTGSCNLPGADAASFDSDPAGGGALEAILQKWISSLQAAVIQESGLHPGDPGMVDAVSGKIAAVMAELSEMAYGFAFSTVIEAYWRGMKPGREEQKQSAPAG